eukprot:gene5158-3707_t
MLQGSDSSSNLVISEQFHHPAKTVRRRVVASSAAHKTPPEGGTHQLFFLDSIGLTSARYLCVAMYRRGITRIPLGRPQKAARTATTKCCQPLTTLHTRPTCCKGNRQKRKEKKTETREEKRKISAIVTLRAACKRPAISNNRKEAVQFRTWEEKIKKIFVSPLQKMLYGEPGRQPQAPTLHRAEGTTTRWERCSGNASARCCIGESSRASRQPSHGARAPLAPCANLAHHPTAVALASPLQLENECWERFAKGGGEKEEEHNRTGLVNAVAEMPWLLAITTDGGRTHAPAERAQRIHTTPHHTARTHVEWRSGSGRRGSELLSNVIPRNSHQPHQLSRVTCKKDHVLNRRRDEQLASACHNPSAIRLSHMRMTTSHKHKRRLHFASQFHHPAKTVRRRVVASSAAHKTPPEGGTHQLFFLDSIGLTSARYLCVAMYRRGITRIPLGRPQKAARTATTKKEKKRKRKQEKKRGKISAIVTLRAACKRPAISNNRKEAVQFRTWEEKIKEKYLFRRSKDALRRAGRQPQAPTLHRAEGTTTRWERCSGNASALDICVAMLYRRVITRIPPAQPWCTGTARTVC